MSYAHTFEDYKAEVAKDAIDYMEDQHGHWDDFESFYDGLWTEDSVTGNGSGSYYFNACKARKAVSEIVWDEEFADMCAEWGMDPSKLLTDGPEAVDVSLRCYALGFVRDELEERWDEIEEEEESEEVE